MPDAVLPETGDPPSRPARWLLRRIDPRQAGPLIALIALAAFGTAINADFLSAGNIANVLTRSAFTGIIAVGATFVITAGGIDLSVGSMAAIVSGVIILLLNELGDVLGAGAGTVAIVLAAGLALGAFAGLLNGLLVTRGRIEPFIVTLGTMGIFRSVLVYVANGGTLTLGNDVRALYRPVFYDTLVGVPYPVLLLIAVAAAGAALLYATPFGRYCVAIGSNDEVARYSGISLDAVRTWTYVLQGACVGLACDIYVPRLGSASSTTGLGWELEAIAAVIVGGTALKGGYGRIGGSLVGAIILTVIGNIMNLSSAVSVYLNGAVQGAIVIAAVLLQRGVATRR
jgi:ribose transport system permease protein